MRRLLSLRTAFASPVRRVTPFALAALTAAGVLAGAPVLAAQAAQGGQPAQAPPPATAGPAPDADGPPAPIAPEVIVRDAEGHATVRAVRLDVPLQIDGVLDEAHYRDVPPFSDFIQMEPRFGQPATERTDVWLAFDDDNVYMSFKAWDSDMAHLVATDMRRDSTSSWQGNDIISVLFDTFRDRRNGIAFTINPLGGRSDGQVVNERQYSSDWNPVWRLKTGRFDGGWTIEAAIPFKSLRYGDGAEQVWGFNAMRVKRSKNEISTVTRVPPARGQQGFQQPSFAATLVGLQAPRRGRNLDIKPYVTSSLTTDRTVTPRIVNDPKGNAGLDLKYAVTQGLAADLTVNTDFAQVEADEQQVNLTRFTLFFPEKREFFLENQGTFSFGGVALGNTNNNNASVAPILFYSRSIGLNQGRQVPLEVGGRLTGRAGRYSVGVLGAHTGELDAGPLSSRPNTFSVLRLKRDILRRSSIGLIATGRSVAARTAGSNLAYGLDAQFGFFDNLQLNTYWAKTQTEGRSTDDTSYRAQLDYNADRYGLQIEQLGVGDNFNPEVGFVRRDDMRRSTAQARFSPRTRRFRSVRKFRYQYNLVYIENGRGTLESREREAEFGIEFQNADQFTVSLNNQYEFLPRPFQIATGVTIPVGGYPFNTAQVAFNMSRQRRASSQLTLEYGTFYSGHRTSFTASQGRVNVTNALSVEPTYSLANVDLREGSFTTHLVGSRVTFTMTPLMFVSALVQYNSGTNSVSTNARLRWEYQPGSELFVVYNEDRNTLARGFPSASTRAVIVKVNRLFRH